MDKMVCVHIKWSTHRVGGPLTEKRFPEQRVLPMNVDVNSSIKKTVCV